MKRIGAKKCLDFVSSPHNHNLLAPVSEYPQYPLELLAPIQEDTGEAQYWFSRETLDLVENTLLTKEIDSVLCMGTPALFQHLNASKRSKFRTFLLDYDDRLSAIFGAEEFARHSMLVNHFYLLESKELYLQQFLKGAEKLVLISDPPFGAVVDALAKTIEEMKQDFFKIDKKRKVSSSPSFNGIVFLPCFVGKHLLKTFPDYSMVDYKVTYSNHTNFGKEEKSVIRAFTDLPNKAFSLEDSVKHRFCELCDRYVFLENVHCSKCGVCPSKDGSPYRHCDVCKTCVKHKYEHCQKCKQCHLKARCYPLPSVVARNHVK